MLRTAPWSGSQHLRRRRTCSRGGALHPYDQGMLSMHIQHGSLRNTSTPYGHGAGGSGRVLAQLLSTIPWRVGRTESSLPCTWGADRLQEALHP